LDDIPHPLDSKSGSGSFGLEYVDQSGVEKARCGRVVKPANHWQSVGHNHHHVDSFSFRHFLFIETLVVIDLHLYLTTHVQELAILIFQKKVPFLINQLEQVSLA
jgi:hypothetical protein